MNNLSLLVPTIMFIVLIILVISIIIYVVNVVRRMECRADERLRIDKEKIDLHDKQIQEINKRLVNIEKCLRR